MSRCVCMCAMYEYALEGSCCEWIVINVGGSKLLLRRAASWTCGSLQGWMNRGKLKTLAK
jgi:hypothetical protein